MCQGFGKMVLIIKNITIELHFQKILNANRQYDILNVEKCKEITHEKLKSG